MTNAGLPTMHLPRSSPARRSQARRFTARHLCARLSTALTTLTTCASLAAAAAPALCAVHCAAMPLAAILLPSLQAVGGSRIFGGMCMHAVGRKLALRFVVPFGLLSSAAGYPRHQSVAVTAASLLGVAAMTAAAAGPCRLVAPYRLCLNLSGCAMMLGSSYFGKKLARVRGHGCGCHCNDSLVGGRPIAEDWLANESKKPGDSSGDCHQNPVCMQ